MVSFFFEERIARGRISTRAESARATSEGMAPSVIFPGLEGKLSLTRSRWPMNNPR